MNARPSTSSISWIVQMFGWFRAEAARASRRNRSNACGSLAKFAGEFHGCGAFFVVVRHVIDPGAYGIAAHQPSIVGLQQFRRRRRGIDMPTFAADFLVFLQAQWIDVSPLARVRTIVPPRRPLPAMNLAPQWSPRHLPASVLREMGPARIPAKQRE
jgi:hypothetical protein